MSSVSHTYRRRRCLSLFVGVSPVLCVYPMLIAAHWGFTRASHPSQTAMPIATREGSWRFSPPSASLAFAHRAYRRWQYLSPPMKAPSAVHCSPFHRKQQCLAPFRGHNIVTSRPWAVMPNAVGTFLLRLLFYLCSLLFSSPLT
ncbi:hypothetical protein AMTRI_Chr12g269110 [Amborella trichopoda]